MTKRSVDALQAALAEEVFSHARDARKAAGRALGTLVEVITYYLLKSWGLEEHTAIERRLPEFGDPGITHNVEFSLHPASVAGEAEFSTDELPITAKKILKAMKSGDFEKGKVKSNQLISTKLILRNSCVIYEDEFAIFVARLVARKDSIISVQVNRLLLKPFAILECKRVGVEEGLGRGPQTIEKAKQGAYVARALSSIQRVKMSDGSDFGVLVKGEGDLKLEPYDEFIRSVVDSEDKELLKDFILTVGVVSNHGNWFSSQNMNKELVILSKSYDWLLFLTDEGLAEFVEGLLFSPKKKFESVKKAFVDSYAINSQQNSITKVKIGMEADIAIKEFITEANAENWLNVISPGGRVLSDLKYELKTLALKKWEEILI